MAVYGAAFNPPHLGHVDVIRQISPLFDDIMLVPSVAHAFGKKMASFETRMKWLELLLKAELPDINHMVISDIEKNRLVTPQHQSPVYSYDLLVALSSQYPFSDLTLIIGPDNAVADTWKKFYRYQDIEKKFAVYVALQRLKIRSTMIRSLMENGKNPDESLLFEMTGKTLGALLVKTYQQQNNNGKAWHEKNRLFGG